MNTKRVCLKEALLAGSIEMANYREMTLRCFTLT